MAFKLKLFKTHTKFVLALKPKVKPNFYNFQFEGVLQTYTITAKARLEKLYQLFF